MIGEAAVEMSLAHGIRSAKLQLPVHAMMRGSTFTDGNRSTGTAASTPRSFHVC
jgi:hypothetical protein